MQLIFTSHAEDMLVERNIDREWVYRAVDEPLKTETRQDGSVHYLKPIAEHGGQILRVVTVSGKDSVRVITIFFDRRMGREK